MKYYPFKVANIAYLVHVTGAREEVSILVEGHGHHAVSQVESLLDTVSVVDVCKIRDSSRKGKE